MNKIRKAWCYIPKNEYKGCFSALRSPTKMNDWIEGYAFENKIVAWNCVEYTVFVDSNSEVWFVEFDATITYEHPRRFLKHY